VAAALTVAGVIVGTAGTASATYVQWGSLGGVHDQLVSCDLYAHTLSVTPIAGPMFYYHAGQVVQADVYIHDTRWAAAQWQHNFMASIAKVFPVSLADPILGASGTEADWQYSASVLPSVTITGLAGHSYQVYVYYTYFSDSRQVVATDMHATSYYSSGHWGFSGSTWIPTSSVSSCGT
jgi:hypothetical protein